MEFGSGDTDGSASAMFDDEMLCNSLKLIPGPGTLALLTLNFGYLVCPLVGRPFMGHLFWELVSRSPSARLQPGLSA